MSSVETPVLDYALIQEAISATGLVCRGGFNVTSDDGYPENWRALILVGDVGGGFWPRFQAERLDEKDPLDNWTRRVLTPVAATLGAEALFPFGGPPHHPFQTWAMRAEGLSAAPIGPLVHAEFGLWHSYRGALVLAEIVAGLPGPQIDHPCDACAVKPCLSTCPVHAFDDREFDLEACLQHLSSGDGDTCMTGGCLARLACPVGSMHAYVADHQAFLANWFVRSFT